MKKILQFSIAFLLSLSFASLQAQQPVDSLLTVRGFAIAAPQVDEVDRFVKFIDEELAPRHVNTLVLRVDYNYQYESRPELRDSIALSKEDVKKLVVAAKRNDIRIIPQVNLLGHQSWAEDLENLLEVYPEFDETPDIEMPEEYEWPNKDGLYCKSYCPLHPDVHDVVFDIVDEIIDVFEADAFHAGMDEVFYIGHEQCPRCHGRDKAELYAGEVTKIRNHLADQGVELWIWGDRLIDGKTTGIGMWEASMNNTHRAIDLIPKDVVINDWHYETAYPTAPYFAMKGFHVVSCPWRTPDVAVKQVNDMIRFKDQSTDVMRERYYGVMQTIWSGAGDFMDAYYEERMDEQRGDSTQWNTFKRMYDEINLLSSE
ncbi:family 20 glycosylhydrolase [Rhodohalobacter sulfatireducens]|uniref:beta-N-acetylhexosaminidase n=1 Tax=Rhodohalobacter sulfatireducens TaxID=2911366 RepID=A0ABS9KGW8_9BACT|nr:family 20 glycosylhydrolase [Rhodohalobacter sulfatireducens]MCG2590097.1 family 20 glycosylhydrolase [Rhodohalobacter sulfatireducens]